jgi:hypothetical protein
MKDQQMRGAINRVSQGWTPLRQTKSAKHSCYYVSMMVAAAKDFIMTQRSFSVATEKLEDALDFCTA